MRGLRPAAAALSAAALLWGAAAGAAGNATSRPAGGALPGFRMVDATAGSVNGEIVFFSDVDREACFERCGALPGETIDNVSLSEARRRLIYNRLILQEQRKLALGAVDNEALAKGIAESKAAMAKCSYPCAIQVDDAEIREVLSERLLVGTFLDRRVAAFIEIPDEEVQRDIGRRAAAEGKDPGSYSEDAVRDDLRREKAKLEIRNWYYKAAANARIFLSPMEEP